MDQFERFFELSTDLLCIAGLDGYFRRVNRAWEETLGWSTAELLSRPFLEFVHPGDRGATAVENQRISTGERPMVFENRYLCRDGSTRWLLWRSTVVPAERVIYSVARDVTEERMREREARAVLGKALASEARDREAAEAMLHISDSRYRSIFERAPVGLFQSTPEGRIVDCNPHMVQMLGYTSAAEVRQLNLGRDVYVDSDERQRFLDRMRREGGVQLAEVRWRHRDGSVLVVQLDGIAVAGADGAIERFDGFVRDLTQQRQLEAQLLHAQKMEAVGRLAGGVAHDFNNLLTAILGHVEFALQELPGGQELREDLEEIRHAGLRAAQLTKQLLTFSRRDVVNQIPIDLNELLVSLERMLERVIGADVQLGTRTDPDLGVVRADPSQIEQVVLNLVVNARDAMPRGGVISLSTSNVDIDESYAETHLGVPPGPYVLLSVSDTGVGMDAATRSRIFEPFFTTKEAGTGTGLGLSTVKGIVESSAGHVWVYSEPGHGTTFKIYLPRTADKAVVETVLPRPEELRGHETVLIVEDEPAVRALAARALARSGYQALEARSAGDALELCRSRTPPIDLMVTDIVMPEMNGPELAAAVRAACPAMRVLFVSGYADESLGVQGLLERGAPFLAKPFSPNQLLAAVRRVLDG